MTQDKITLYHYVHCPFCVRVRMVLGFLHIPFDSQVLSYNDEATPVQLTNKKMLPIVKFATNDVMNESLDIIAKLDKKNQLEKELLNSNAAKLLLNETLDQLGNPIHSLCMPYWMYTPEFDETSRAYFKHKKELKRGPFYKIIQNKQKYLDELTPLLNSLESRLEPFFTQDHFTILDIIVAAHLWGLYIFPEFQFSPTLHTYLQSVKELCRFEYHVDFWKNDSTK